MSSEFTSDRIIMIPRWYFGGVSTVAATCITHPLDLVKVHMQTKKGTNISVFRVTQLVFKREGMLGFYNGISASLTRQFTVSTTRFGIYESLKQMFADNDNKLAVHKSVLIAGVSGFAGGVPGNPFDVINVRMQNDIKLQPSKRRNYQNVFHGLYCVVRDEGVTRLWVGTVVGCLRIMVVNIGQICFYDYFKQLMLSKPYFKDDVVTHITASSLAGATTTTLCQPIDVLKTRAMSAKPGEVSSFTGLVTATLKEGPQAFYKGFVPAFVRLAPHTILTFVFLEQLRLRFGIMKIVS